MATMEDRLLGEKLHYYCSSDESDIEEEDDGKVEEEEFSVDKSRQARLDEIQKRDTAYMNGPRQHNTGIKGVKEDARAYQYYILQKEQERLDELAKTAARFCLDEKPKSDDELDFDSDDEFMAAYRSKRMLEMKEKANPSFGRIFELSDKDFCEVIDGAHPNTDVVVYVHEEHLPACRRYKESLSRIAAEFPRCMICHIRASKAHMSANFIQKGLPCFIKYKAGEVKKTWVNIRDFIGDDAEFDVLVEGLQDNGILPYE